MTAWWLCESAVRLRAQINARWPGRDHSSDGAVGDASHLSRKSDHNPSASSNPAWVVRAIDIDESFATDDDPQAERLVAELIATDDPRLAYIIFEGLIYSRRRHWLASVYTGANRHEHHVHVSFSALGDHDGTPFRCPVLEVV